MYAIRSYYANVNFANEKARVRYIPTLVSQVDLRKRVRAAGFEAVESGNQTDDAERKAREAEISEQRNNFV